MIHFKMTVKENFASFIDSETGIMVFVDSFDNQEFDVRIGDLLESKPVGTIKAENDKILGSPKIGSAKPVRSLIPDRFF